MSALLLLTLTAGFLVLAPLALLFWAARAVTDIPVKDIGAFDRLMEELRWIIVLGTTLTAVATLLDFFTSGTIETSAGRVFPGHDQSIRGQAIATGFLVAGLAAHCLARLTKFSESSSNIDGQLPVFLVLFAIIALVLIGLDRWILSALSWYRQLPWLIIGTAALILLAAEGAMRNWRPDLAWAVFWTCTIAGALLIARNHNATPYSDDQAQRFSFQLQCLRQTLVPSSHPILAAGLLALLIRRLWHCDLWVFRWSSPRVSYLMVVGSATAWLVAAWTLQGLRGENWVEGSTSVNPPRGERTFAGYLTEISLATANIRPLRSAWEILVSSVPKSDSPVAEEIEPAHALWRQDAMGVINHLSSLPESLERQELRSEILESPEPVLNELAVSAGAFPGPAAVGILKDLVSLDPPAIGSGERGDLILNCARSAMAQPSDGRPLLLRTLLATMDPADAEIEDRQEIARLIAEAAVDLPDQESIPLLMAAYAVSAQDLQTGVTCAGAISRMTPAQAVSMSRQLISGRSGGHQISEIVEAVSENLQPMAENAPVATIQALWPLTLELSQLRPGSGWYPENNLFQIQSALLESAAETGGEVGADLMSKIVEECRRDDALLTRFLELTVTCSDSGKADTVSLPPTRILGLVEQIAKWTEQDRNQSLHQRAMEAALVLGVQVPVTREFLSVVAAATETRGDSAKQLQAAAVFSRHGGPDGANELCKLLATAASGKVALTLVSLIGDLAADEDPGIVGVLNKHHSAIESVRTQIVRDALRELACEEVSVMELSGDHPAVIPGVGFSADTVLSAQRRFNGIAQTLRLAGDEELPSLIGELITLHKSTFSEQIHTAWLRRVIDASSGNREATLLCIRAASVLTDPEGSGLVRQCLAIAPTDEELVGAAIAAQEGFPTALRLAIAKDISASLARMSPAGEDLAIEFCESLSAVGEDERLPILADLIRSRFNTKVLEVAASLIAPAKGERAADAAANIIDTIVARLDAREDRFTFSYYLRQAPVVTSAGAMEPEASLLAACLRSLDAEDGGRLASVSEKVTSSVRHLRSSKSKLAVFLALFGCSKRIPHEQRSPLLINLRSAIEAERESEVYAEILKEVTLASVGDSENSMRERAVTLEELPQSETRRSRGMQKKGLFKRLFGR